MTPNAPISGAALGAWAALAVAVVVASQWRPSSQFVRYTLTAVMVYLLLTRSAAIAGPIESFGRALQGN